MSGYIVLLFACFVCVGCADKSVQPVDNRQYKIAFTYADSSGEVLAKVNRDGSGLSTVHRLNATSFSLRWSPNGLKLAFDVYNVDLGIVNTDGSGFRIFSGTSPGSWFQDSERLAFSTNDTIYSLVLATGYRSVIGFGSNPEVSPSGNKIAFIRNSNLYTMNPDGTSELYLTDSVSGGLAWSRSGEKIAFGNKKSALCIIGRNGENKTQVTPDGAIVPRKITWSSDGSKLAYEHIYGVKVVNADGSNDTWIEVNASYPDWCPDGSVIIYNSSYSGLVMVSPDGADSTQVVSLRPNFSVSWSPVPLP